MCRMKLEPMNPLPPVTSSFTALPARHVPDFRTRVVPRQPALVARRRFGREVDVGEVDDASRGRTEVPHAVGHAGWNANEARGARTEREPQPRPLGLRALP